MPNFSLPKLEIGKAIELVVRWLIENLAVLFDIIKKRFSKPSPAVFTMH